MKILCPCYEGIYEASMGIAPLIINLDTKWRRVLDFHPWLLYLWGKNILTLTQRTGTKSWVMMALNYSTHRQTS